MIFSSIKQKVSLKKNERLIWFVSEIQFHREYVQRKLETFLQKQGPSFDALIVTEKIHGANFSFIVFDDGKQVAYASRNGIIQKDQKFFGFETVVSKYDKDVKEIFHRVKTMIPDCKVVRIFGEYFGGRYPNIESPPESMIVQKGVWYCPYNEFCPFDILVTQHDGEDVYLDYEQKHPLFLQHFNAYLPPLFVGSLNEALLFDQKFDSEMPSLLGLPKISDNICEGIVISPEHPHFKTDKSGKKLERLIMKKKNEEFSEKVKEKKPAPEKFHFTEEESNDIGQVLQYLTENRARNVFSKYGIPPLSHLIIELVEDAVKDLEQEREKPIVLNKKMTNFLRSESAILIKKVFSS